MPTPSAKSTPNASKPAHSTTKPPPRIVQRQLRGSTRNESDQESLSSKATGADANPNTVDLDGAGAIGGADNGVGGCSEKLVKAAEGGLAMLAAMMGTCFERQAAETRAGFASLNNWSEEIDNSVQQLQYHQEDADDRIERLSRQCDVTIRNVPLTGKENLHDLRRIVMKIGTVISCELSDRDIMHVHRLGREGAKGGSLLVARFGSFGVRTHFFKCYMVQKAINPTALGFKSGDKIYVSDNLTKRNGEARNRAAALKKSNAIKSHTVRDGLVCIVLNGEDGRRHVVHSAHAIDQLVKSSVIDSRLNSSMGQMELNRNC